MTFSVYLTRTHEARNEARFYVITLQLNLFGEWSVVREWGRIGRGGQVREAVFMAETEAEREFWRIHQVKIKRGYCPHAV